MVAVAQRDSVQATSLTFIATNRKNPYTGYGKLEIGLEKGFKQVGVRLDANAPIAIITGEPKWWRAASAGHRKWLYTMSESTRVSEGWVKAINNHYERVLVPCPELVSIYQESGVRVPVHAIGMGVDLSMPRLVRREKPTEDQPFVFLGYSLGDMRKAANKTIELFRTIFKDDKRYRLVIKCRDDALWLAGCKNPNTEIVIGSRSERYWHKMMRDAHAFVFPSRGEGWGMPPREAVLSGLPTIATEWLGMWDVRNWGYPVGIAAMWPCQFDYWEANAPEGQWAEPCDSELIEWMRWIPENYNAALEKARAGRQYLLDNWRWKHVAQNIVALAGAE